MTPRGGLKRLLNRASDLGDANVRFEPHLLRMAFNPQSPLAKLLAAPIRPGRVIWLGLRPERRVAMTVVQAAEFDRARGIVGARYQRPDGSRQVTLIGKESLCAIATFLGRDVPISPEFVRRNVVVAGLNLLALKVHRFRIGQALLETSGEIGVGGYNAIRGQGGITATIIEDGRDAIGDSLSRAEP